MSCSNPWPWSLLSYPPSRPSLLSKSWTPPAPLCTHSPSVPAPLPNRTIAIMAHRPDKSLSLPSLLQYGTLFASIVAPAAMAVTGDNNVEEDLAATLLTGGILAVLYLFVFPPIIMNWLRLRWYKRGFAEMYFQFMFVFIFFPGSGRQRNLQATGCLSAASVAGQSQASAASASANVADQRPLRNSACARPATQPVRDPRPIVARDLRPSPACRPSNRRPDTRPHSRHLCPRSCRRQSEALQRPHSRHYATSQRPTPHHCRRLQ